MKLKAGLDWARARERSKRVAMKQVRELAWGCAGLGWAGLGQGKEASCPQYSILYVIHRNPALSAICYPAR